MTLRAAMRRHSEDVHWPTLATTGVACLVAGIFAARHTDGVVFYGLAALNLAVYTTVARWMIRRRRSGGPRQRSGL